MAVVVTISGLPSPFKSPRARPVGDIVAYVTREAKLGVLDVDVLINTETSPDPKSVLTISNLPSPFTSASATSSPKEPVVRVGPATKVPFPLLINVKIEPF